MKRFYIITNTLKDKDYKITQEIQTYIEQNGGECILSEKDGDGHKMCIRDRDKRKK